MNELWSRRSREMVPYTIGEQPRQGKFIKLNTNENPYPPSPMAIQALREAVGEKLQRYPDPECTELREAIGQLLDVKAEQVFVGNGSDEVLSLAFQAFFDPDRPVRFPDVTYSFYPTFASFYGLPYEEISLGENFALPVEEFLKPGGGVVVANPNAPTGRELDLCDLRSIVEANRDTVVIVDEAYVDFGSRSCVELVEHYSNLLVVRTLSKGRSLAGLRVGYAVGQEELIAALRKVRDCFNPYPVDQLAQAAAIGAIRDETYFRITTSKITNSRTRLEGDLQAMGFICCDSAANFLFVTHEKVEAKVLLDGLRERGILVRWWDTPARIRNYLRISIGTDEEMRALCKALAEIIGENT